MVEASQPLGTPATMAVPTSIPPPPIPGIQPPDSRSPLAEALFFALRPRLRARATVSDGSTRGLIAAVIVPLAAGGASGPLAILPRRPELLVPFADGAGLGAEVDGLLTAELVDVSPRVRSAKSIAAAAAVEACQGGLQGPPPPPSLMSNLSSGINASWPVPPPRTKAAEASLCCCLRTSGLGSLLPVEHKSTRSLGCSWFCISC